MRLLIDTNVLIDFYGRREPYCHDVDKLLVAQAFGDVELWASAKSFTDVFYVLKPAIGVEALQGMFLSSLEELRVCSIAREDVMAAARESWPDFEDCLVNRAAQKVKADRIITRDARGFTRSPVKAQSADDFLRYLASDQGITYEELSC